MAANVDASGKSTFFIGKWKQEDTSYKMFERNWKMENHKSSNLQLDGKNQSVDSNLCGTIPPSSVFLSHNTHACEYTYLYV